MSRLSTPLQEALEAAALSACFSTSVKMSFFGNFGAKRPFSVFNVVREKRDYLLERMYRLIWPAA